MLYFGFVQAPIRFVVKLVQLPTYLIKKRLSSYNRNGLTSHFWPTHDVNKIQYIVGGNFSQKCSSIKISELHKISGSGTY